MYAITANNKTYEVHPHAARRMLRRGIEEAWIIETLENGSMTTQANGRDRYVHEVYDDIREVWVDVVVVVAEDNLLIVTIIDDTPSE